MFNCRISLPLCPFFILQDRTWIGNAVKFTKANDVDLTPTSVHSMCVNIKDEMFLRIQKDLEAFRIEVRDKSIKSQCSHCTCRIIDIPNDLNHILEFCMDCQSIKAYSVTTTKGKTVRRQCIPYRVCKGPGDTILVMDDKYHISQFLWDKNRMSLHLKRTLYTHISNAFGMCYVEHYNILVITSRSPGLVRALGLANGQPVWKFAGNVNEREITPRAVSTDADGRIYVADHARILLIEGAKGKLVQTFQPEDNEEIMEISCTNDPIQLLLLYNGINISDKITCYNVTDE